MSRALLLLVVGWLCVACGAPAPIQSLSGGTRVEEPNPVPIDWQQQVAKQEHVLALTDPGRLPEIHLAHDREARLPLQHTHVSAHLHGFIGEVEVKQTFNNTHDEAIEVVYVFPLPENSAVGAMHMVIGERTIRAKIEERKRAKRIYRRAKRQGKTAALLEQERPNVFTQSVANIAPGENIDVVIRYTQDLTYDDGAYEFVFPMVVGPRFIPGTPMAAAMSGDGTYADTHRVPDASRITPPVLGKGERSGHDISVEVTVENALPVRSVAVATHTVATHQSEDGSLELRLTEEESIPNRDFVMRYRVAGKEPRATLLTSGEPNDGYFALVVHPPELDVDELVGKRELIFVVDVSGSMSGTPLGMCKSAIRTALSKMRPWDTFNIVTFAGATRRAFASSRPANATHIKQALDFLMAARAGGGTHLDNAVAKVLTPDATTQRNRYVFFLTDGYVGNEKQIVSRSKRMIETLENQGLKARVFSFGVGSSTNRALLDGLARAGHGVAVYATNREDPARAVNQFYRYIDRQVLTDLRLTWGDLGAAETFPNPIPDLFASHPVVVHGRYRRAASGPVRLHARVGETDMTMDVEVRKTLSTGKRGGVLGTLWARSKISALQEEAWIGMRPDAPQRITKLGLAYDLVTAYTSFIAVDESRIVGDGAPTKVVQPVETPEAVDGVAAGARKRKSVQHWSTATPRPIPGLMPTPTQAGRQDFDDDDDDDEDDDDGSPNTFRYEQQPGGSPEPPPSNAPAPPELESGGRCLCKAAGAPASGDGPAWTVLALAAAMLSRRRRRH